MYTCSLATLNRPDTAMFQANAQVSILYTVYVRYVYPDKHHNIINIGRITELLLGEGKGGGSTKQKE
jgi:hypothetical protein